MKTGKPITMKFSIELDLSVTEGRSLKAAYRLLDEELAFIRNRCRDVLAKEVKKRYRRKR